MVVYLDALENDLLACLCEMLVAEGRPVCACHHYAGENKPPSNRCHTNDVGGNGQAWLRRDTSLMGSDNGQITFAGMMCAVGGWETTIELGIYRCITAIPDEAGNAPSIGQYGADRDLMNADKQTLYRVLCCDTWQDNDFGFSVVDARIDPIGPSGACAGSMLTIVVDGDPTGNDDPQFAVAVDADPNQPSGYRARVRWNLQRQFVSGPAGIE